MVGQFLAGRGDLATVETAASRVQHWACPKLLSLPPYQAGRTSCSSERASWLCSKRRWPGWDALGGAPWSWSGVKREWARPPSCIRFVTK